MTHRLYTEEPRLSGPKPRLSGHHEYPQKWAWSRMLGAMVKFYKYFIALLIFQTRFQPKKYQVE